MKRVVKKPRRYTPTIIGEGDSTAAPPSPVPLVIKLSALRQTGGKAVHDLSKISSILATYTYIFHIAHYLFYDSGTETARDPRAEAVGKREITMIPCSLIKKVTRLATSSPQKTLGVMWPTSVLRVLGPQMEVPWPLAL